MVDCVGCTLCCRHVSVGVDEPEDDEDLDELVWLLLHENIAVYIDDEGDWYVEFITPCTALTADGRCSIHGDHPEMCRGYDPESCLAHGEGDWFEHYFKTPEELREYWRSI